MRTLTNIIIGIIIGILIIVLAVGVGGYVILTQEGMVGTIDDAVDEVSFEDEYRELSLLAFLDKAMAALGDLENKSIGEVEKIVGTDGISATIADSVGVSQGIIKTSALSNLGNSLSSNLNLAGMSDTFGIALPEDIPLFQNDDFLNEPVAEAFGSLDDYTLDSFIEVIYEDEATADKPASSGLLQNLGGMKLSELSSGMDEIIDNTYITDILDVDENSSEIMKYLASGGEGGNPVKVGELDGAVNDMKISNAVEIGSDASPVLKYLRDCELTITAEDGTTTVEIGASLNNINEAIKQMTIGDAVEIVSTSSLALKYMQNFKLDELDAGIKSMKISDAVAINDNSHAVIRAIKDLTLDELGDGDALQSKIDTLRLGEVITLQESSPKILKALQYSRLGNLDYAVDNLEMQEIFEDDKLDSGLLALVDPTTKLDDIPDAFEKAVQQTTLYGLQQIDLFNYSRNTTSDRSYFKTMELVGTHNALIENVANVIAGRDFGSLAPKTVYLYEIYENDADRRALYADADSDPSNGNVAIDSAAFASGQGGWMLGVDEIEKILSVLPEDERYAAVIVAEDVAEDSGTESVTEMTIAGGVYNTLFSVDMQAVDDMQAASGKLWLGEADEKMEFPNKAGGYAFFHAGSIHLNGNTTPEDLVEKGGYRALSTDEIPVEILVAMIGKEGSKKPMTLVEINTMTWDRDPTEEVPGA